MRSQVNECALLLRVPPPRETQRALVHPSGRIRANVAAELGESRKARRRPERSALPVGDGSPGSSSSPSFARASGLSSGGQSGCTSIGVILVSASAGGLRTSAQTPSHFSLP